MDTLILFDVNGTIIKRDSRTDIPFSLAIDQFLNLKNCMEGVDTTARSDKDVFIEILEKNNINFTDENWNSFLKIYESKLEDYKDSDIWRENVDAISFIKLLKNKGYTLSLITGELEIGAKYKLKKLGVWDFFDTGGFGEDGLVRFDIADKALEKSKNFCKKDFDKIIVIGDTILDIKTARHLGAKIISITTGGTSREDLKAEKPDYLIDRFSELTIF